MKYRLMPGTEMGISSEGRKSRLQQPGWDGSGIREGEGFLEEDMQGWVLKDTDIIKADRKEVQVEELPWQEAQRKEECVSAGWSTSVAAAGQKPQRTRLDPEHSGSPRDLNRTR